MAKRRQSDTERDDAARNLARLVWAEEADDPADPPPSPAQIERAQAHWNVRFPATYLALLEVRNGGYLRPELEDELLGIGRDEHATIEGRTWADLEDWADDWLPPEHEKLVPFAGDGHTWLCFDYRNAEDEPTITQVNLECSDEEAVASTFAEFLERDILAAREARHERTRHKPRLHLVTTRTEVEEAVSAGADVNEPDGEGATPLMTACSAHRDEVVLALLEAGADPTKRHERLGLCALELVHHASVAVLERMLASASFERSTLSGAMESYRLQHDEERIRVLERHTGVGRDDFDKFFGVTRVRT